MKTTVLAAAVLLSQLCLAEMTTKKWVWFHTDMTSYRSEMLTIPVRFIIGVPHKTKSYYGHTTVYASNSDTGGRWQKAHQIWDNNVKIGKLIGTWNLRSPDGKEAFAGIACEAVSAQGEKKILKVEAKQLKEFPDWVFYHYSGCVPHTMAFASIALRPQPILRYQRSIWLEWDGGKAECGDREQFPWFGPNHKRIDGFAVYSRGGEKEFRECEMAVWMPEQYSRINAIRFRRNDDRYSFYFVNSAGEYTFALGARTTESGERKCAPNFIRKERAEIAAQLRNIDWTLKADITMARKKYEEVRKLAGKSPEAQHLPKILEDIDSGETIRILNAENRLELMKKELSSLKLDGLFD